MRAFRFIDLFAGLGGFHLALARMGGQCVFAAEWKEHLRELYETNHGLKPAGDIREVHPSDVPEHDVLTAGFPCQPFSKAGEQLGFECTEQGNLFFNVAAILKEKKPTFFILENVPNLLKHDKGRTWEQILRILGTGEGGLGYDIRAQRLSPHHFGIPQIRERVYIVGSLLPLDSFVWPEINNAETNIDTVLDDRPADARQLSPQVKECLEVWNEFLKACPRDVTLPSFPLWSMEWGATYPYETTTPHALKTLYGMDGLKGFRGSHGIKMGTLKSLDGRWSALPSHARTADTTFPKWKQNFIRQNRQFYEDNKSWIDPWLPKILKFPSSLQKFEWNVKGGKRNIWDYVIQFRASGVRVKRRTTAPSLIAMTDTQVPIIGWQKRYMTPLECARLQSLDGLNELPKRPSQAFAALGNAVNSNVVEMVARALLAVQPQPKGKHRSHLLETVAA
ncbi:DNA-cytosine methyltransferase [Burkholderia pseudomallei]|uniref:DNA cytosine methyltransferase n=1 Tax=Burkholderia pseudomallei TaxID=28450 RepID=UPI00031178DF|nr:DNA (cytosine-5-)-methyltransferase [Burkholderia pseudomallei]CAJ3034835.1 DNA-cytosine methyltransferase [Burkholderia pseudomallei]CAJ3105816.1 DNA-cytosine methyltransferase [Burkholderia pseudomallei]CAJ4190407.1 DNA-cytosine methyltransferase [Burkholderia pseudomallei]CAJ4404004.1 DNA-cytosine methyltransferase [Burkholderia pseudomallei]CAJ4589341.1 DNA-cytosine methyltransferase [Burkholderia pseudomallei]